VLFHVLCPFFWHSRIRILRIVFLLNYYNIMNNLNLYLSRLINAILTFYQFLYSFESHKINILIFFLTLDLKKNFERSLHVICTPLFFVGNFFTHDSSFVLRCYSLIFRLFGYIFFSWI
jgi:hypothetical protein